MADFNITAETPPEAAVFRTRTQMLGLISNASNFIIEHEFMAKWQQYEKEYLKHGYCDVTICEPLVVSLVNHFNEKEFIKFQKVVSAMCDTVEFYSKIIRRANHLLLTIYRVDDDKDAIEIPDAAVEEVEETPEKLLVMAAHA